MEAGDPEGAAVAYSPAQDLPGITQVVAIPPGYGGHIAKVFGLGLSETEWHRRFQFGPPVFLELVRSHELVLLPVHCLYHRTISARSRTNGRRRPKAHPRA